MINRSSSGNRLGRQALLFPLCLVLYEFSTYIGNDMIQPGMLAVVEQYNASRVISRLTYQAEGNDSELVRLLKNELEHLAMRFNQHLRKQGESK